MSSNKVTTQELFEIQITSTTKSYRPDDEYRIQDRERVVVETMKEVREKLIELYGHCKRAPMYVEGPQRDPIRVGWVYCFNNESNDRGEIQNFRQQDWVQVMQLTGQIIDPVDIKH